MIVIEKIFEKLLHNTSSSKPAHLFLFHELTKINSVINPSSIPPTLFLSLFKTIDVVANRPINLQRKNLTETIEMNEPWLIVSLSLVVDMYNFQPLSHYFRCAATFV